MGNPTIYYKRALQDFAYNLAWEDEDFYTANRLIEENSIEVLETYIAFQKDKMDENLFFYNAGHTTVNIINQAYEEGGDPLNASIGGLNEFEYFIGIREEDD